MMQLTFILVSILGVVLIVGVLFIVEAVFIFWVVSIFFFFFFFGGGIEVKNCCETGTGIHGQNPNLHIRICISANQLIWDSESAPPPCSIQEKCWKISSSEVNNM